METRLKTLLKIRFDVFLLVLVAIYAVLLATPRSGGHGFGGVLTIFFCAVLIRFFSGITYLADLGEYWTKYKKNVFTLLFGYLACSLLSLWYYYSGHYSVSMIFLSIIGSAMFLTTFFVVGASVRDIVGNWWRKTRSSDSSHKD